MSLILDLTIAIPVKNEEKNLPGCLQAIGKDFASHVVVIDSGSTDQTKELAREFGAEVLDFVWDGKFPKKRNWFLRTHTPNTKWVFFLDADEYLTDAFKTELRKAIELDDNKVGYWLSYTVYFLGKQLKGGYPLRKLALFQVGAGEYEKIDEDQWSLLDMEVHEHPVLDGEVGIIRSKIDHQDFRGVSNFVLKHNEYASWEAARFLKGMTEPQSFAKLTWKQRLKYRLLNNSVLIGPAFFCGSYFLLGGFRDGARGFAHAVLRMSYFVQVYCKIQERGVNQ
ncbi:glycosyltransferase family 2 protein [Pontibacter pamirensis]|uniref:glycosyltransferase family 2 protein n=1 Tax=Pontibacter pamirensis TaxID=2562824 RepID=UPI001F354672|nr:glycosyltransferase family 2 protein [Pontibacter pamirensis]